MTNETDAFESAREALRALLALLDDPHPGLFTWMASVAEARARVLIELGDGVK